MGKQPVKTIDEGKRIDDEYKLKRKMSPERLDEKVIKFFHHCFPDIEIYVIFKHPGVDELSLFMSKSEIKKYIDHKHYDFRYNGRCVYEAKKKKIIVSVNGFNPRLPKTLNTLAHEMNHAAHRLFGSENIDFTEEGLCTLMGDLVELSLTVPGQVPFTYDDLLWNEVIIKTPKHEVCKNK